jgi:hypothetical protein
MAKCTLNALMVIEIVIFLKRIGQSVQKSAFYEIVLMYICEWGEMFHHMI